MSDINSVKTQIQSLINLANETTGNTDTNLTDGVNALVSGIEAVHPNKEYFMTNIELIRKPKYYLEAGPDGYITSESYLTEKRMEGGEV